MITAIFDMDGTLADTIADLSDAVNHGLRELGYPEHSYEEYKHFVGNGAQKLCFRALPDDHKDDADKLHKLFSEYYGSHFLDKTVIYDGIAECLASLEASGVQLAVATNKPQDFARSIASALLPNVRFLKVLGGCSERPKKPDKSIIEEILDGLPAENKVFMIGDSNVDISTGKNAGITSIGCLWGFRDRKELENEGADFIAETPSDITSIILK
ncbi:MAG: HAD family hydrolase [Ruminococcus sp.]|nr:HAD family hydrolase [Ruminococcus sp.]